MKNNTISWFALAMSCGLLAGAAHAQMVITEVDPTGSNAGTTYAADWFELKNTGSSAVDITGWKMDDNSASFASAVPIRGVTSIAAGQSVVFIEGNTSGSSDATIDANFIAAWFGAVAPTGLVIGNYGGSGVGLSATSDAVNIYNAAGVLQAGVTFGASSTGFTFDNAAGLNGAISQLSAVGVNGAFQSFDGVEVGSPGQVPEPSTLALGALSLAGISLLRRGRKV